MTDTQDTQRIEKEIEVEAFIAKLKYALENGASISFQENRQVDKDRDIKYTNRYAISNLFPNENPVDILKRELITLSKKEYIQTVKDIRYSNRSEMREFGRKYNLNDEIYIKIRVELLDSIASGRTTTFVMSFHYTTTPFSDICFPYCN